MSVNAVKSESAEGKQTVATENSLSAQQHISGHEHGSVPGKAQGKDQDKTAAKKPADKPKTRSKRPARTQRITMRVATEVIQVVRNVESADQATRSLAAKLFNIAPEVDELAAAIATADKSTVGVVSSLIGLRNTQDPLDRMVAIANWDTKTTTTPAWRFLHAVDLVSRQMPGNDTKAAAEFVKVLDELPPEIDDVLDLLN